MFDWSLEFNRKLINMNTVKPVNNVTLDVSGKFRNKKLHDSNQHSGYYCIHLNYNYNIIILNSSFKKKKKSVLTGFVKRFESPGSD